MPIVKSLLAYLALGLLAGLPMPRDGRERPRFAAQAPAVDVLTPTAALPSHIAGSFQEITACQQSPDGEYFIFDRRAHSVYTATAGLEQARKLIEIGAEPGRVLTPTAFDLARDGTFVIADAPRGAPRIQIFTTSGSTLGGFLLRGRSSARIVLQNLVLNGLGSVEYTGRSIYLSQPELGALVVEYAANGTAIRTFGALRRTGHESDADVHLALNAGLVVASADGGVYFVFLAGIPQFRKYDAMGSLVFERHIQGVELDAFIERLPDTWKRRKTEDGLIPIVPPSVHAAAVDPRGQLWISLATGYTFVYDSNGEKRRTIQFQAAGPIAPISLSFGRNGRVLVAPGCYAFDPGGR